MAGGLAERLSGMAAVLTALAVEMRWGGMTCDTYLGLAVFGQSKLMHFEAGPLSRHCQQWPLLFSNPSQISL